MSQKLTPKLVRKIFPDANSKEIERLDVSAKDISEVGDLTTCPNLIRLDLSQNAIQDTSFAATCQQIKWLSLANNPISDLESLQCLTNLQVLNVGHAKLSGKIRLDGLDQLGALILNDNQITAVAGLKRLSNLNTLVLKQNAIARLGSSLHKCSALQKLSMAHNQLTEIGDALMHCTALKELRLNHNAIIQLPPELSHNSQLRIVDIGDNPIGDTASIKVLASLPWLKNLNLKGSVLAQREGYPQNILQMLPNLDILDNKRVAERSKHQLKATADVSKAGGYDALQSARAPGAAQVDRADRTKSASTSKEEPRLAAKPDKSKKTGDKGAAKAERKAHPGDRHEKSTSVVEKGVGAEQSEVEAKLDSQAKPKKKRRIPESDGQAQQIQFSKRTKPENGAGERGGPALEKKKQTLQDVDKGAATQGRRASTKTEEQLANRSMAEQGDTPSVHRPPVVGVFEAKTGAGSKKQLHKGSALARGSQAAALLAAVPEALGIASAAWSWDDPPVRWAAEPGTSGKDQTSSKLMNEDMTKPGNTDTVRELKKKKKKRMDVK